MTQKLAVIVGSTRKGSINKKLALALTKLGAKHFEASFIEIDKLPMYNEDLEKESPAEVLAFAEQVKQFDKILIVTPEHNRSVSALLKNAIDWGSRPVSGRLWSGKAVATAGTTPGAIGTALAQEHLRNIMVTQGASVMGGELYFTMKPDLIDEDGNVSNPDTQKFLQSYIDRFAAFADKLAA